MKGAVLAAKDDKAGDEKLEMNGWHGDTMTSDPDYETPFVKDLELVFVVFDILYLRDQVCPASYPTLLHSLHCSSCHTVNYQCDMTLRDKWPLGWSPAQHPSH